MKQLIGEGLARVLMDFITTLDLGYVVGDNFVAGQWPQDMRDLDGLLLSTVVLAQFEEGGELNPTGRQCRQQRIFRYVVRETNPQVAVDRAWHLLQAIMNKRQYDADGWHVLVARPAKLPSLMVRQEDGSCFADFVLIFNAWNT